MFKTLFWIQTSPSVVSQARCPNSPFGAIRAGPTVPGNGPRAIHAIQRTGNAKRSVLSQGASAPTWRDRANKVRKVGSVEQSIKIAEDYLKNFTDGTLLRTSRPEDFEKAQKKLLSHREDEGLTKLFRDPVAGTVDPDGVLLLEKVDKLGNQMGAIKLLIEALQAADEGGVGCMEDVFEGLVGAQLITVSIINWLSTGISETSRQYVIVSVPNSIAVIVGMVFCPQVWMG